MNLVAALMPFIAVLQPSPSLTVELVPGDYFVEPGVATPLAINIKIQDGWHIYHPIILDTGAPTEIDFTLPAGVKIGELRYPAPYLGETAGLEYLAHDGEITVLTDLELDPDAPAGPLTIKAEVFALACKELCVPVTAEAAVTINDPDISVPDDHGQQFERAADALPQRLRTAEYLRGSRVLVSHEEVPVGGEFDLIVKLNVQAGHHIQDRNAPAGFIATRVFVEVPDGIKFLEEEQSWPEPHLRTVEGTGEVRELGGEVLIRLPYVIDDTKFEPGPVSMRVLIPYQACNDQTGQCYMPMTAATRAGFTVVSADQPPVVSTDPQVAEARAQLTQRAAAAPAVAGSASGTVPSAAAAGQLSLPMVFLFAFLGGVILNIMPCVLPVISLKIFGFVQQAGDDPGRVLRMGLVYAGGIMASFAVIAIVMVSAKLAWGGLMQQPGFLIGLSAVVFAFALSLLGVYEIQLPGSAVSAASAAGTKEGYTGAFLNGIMATLLATPCVGPFLGSAVGVLAQLPDVVAAGGIMTVGLGLAAPYVLLTAFPGWLRYLPKPGPWMVTFKQVVGFILVLVVVWLLSILVHQVDEGVLLGTLGLLTFVSVGCWIIGRITLSMSTGRTLAMYATALFLATGGGALSFQIFVEGPSEIPWQPWEPGIAQRLAAEGHNVYVDYTATWCLTCQTNKTLVLETSRVAREFRKRGIYPIKADFTNYEPKMQAELQAHGRNGVPLNIVLAANKPDDAIVLPEVLTQGIVLGALEEVPPTAEPPAFWQDEPPSETEPSLAASD